MDKHIVPSWSFPKLRIVWSRKFRSTLEQYVRDIKPHIIHDHGLWLPMNHASASVAEANNVPFIISPRGMVEPWALKYKRWKKLIALIAYQGRDLKRALLFHAASMEEVQSLRSLGIKQPIALIPNGVEIPNWTNTILARKNDRRTVLFLSRVHPSKGLLNLVKAWSKVRPNGWRLVIAGPDENNHRAEVEAMIQATGLYSDSCFLGPVDDADKWDLYRKADLFVLPSFSENFGIVVAEALACSVPVITTKSTPWEEVLTVGCGWWVNIGVDPLVEALREAISLTDLERSVMGARGRKYIEARFSWEKIGSDMRQVYEWILGRGPMPICVSNN